MDRSAIQRNDRGAINDNRTVFDRLFFSVIVLSILLSSVSSLTAMDLGKATIQLVDGTSIEATIDSVDPSGNVTGSNIPEGFNLLEILGLKTNRTPPSG